MKDALRTAVVGLGCRGTMMIRLLLTMTDDFRIVSVCDTYLDRVEKAAQTVKDATGETPFGTTDYREILARGGIDCVLVMTSWNSHVRIALDAMRAHIPVGLEVGGAQTLDECYDLLRVQKETGTPFMLLENCCYGRNEMMVMRMVREGVLGKVVSCEGGYRHDLRDEITMGGVNRHYRLEEYKNRNCENYPTHELGPIAQVLGIGKTNRFLTLTSVASASFGLHDFAVRNEKVPEEVRNTVFAQGDVVKTVLTCAGGELVTLTLDTCLPRPYSRMFTVQGTRGMFAEDGKVVFPEEDMVGKDHFNFKEFNNVEAYREKYEHPVWQKFLSDGVRGGHGGMDYLVYHEFADCLKNGREFPITALDAAIWMAVTPLSEVSIRERRTVEFPDFAAFL